MRSSHLAALLLALPAASACTGAGESSSSPTPSFGPVLCRDDVAPGTCLDALQRELSAGLEEVGGAAPLDDADFEQVLEQVVRAERIRPAHSYLRVTEQGDQDGSGSAPATPVEFRLGVADVQRTLWACLPTSAVVSPGPCPPAA